MTKIIVSECWKLEANWEHEGENVTQRILCPTGEHCCPFMIDHVKLYYDQPWLNRAVEGEKKGTLFKMKKLPTCRVRKIANGSRYVG